MKINSLLRIKYGLALDPTDDAVKHWHVHFLMLCEKGLDSEQAEYEAAKNEFVDFEHVNYASQTEKIDEVLEALLKHPYNGLYCQAPKDGKPIDKKDTLRNVDSPTSAEEKYAEQG
jgi:hypothetical protein